MNVKMAGKYPITIMIMTKSTFIGNYANLAAILRKNRHLKISFTTSIQ